MASPQQICGQLSLIAEEVSTLRSALETASIGQSEWRRPKLKSNDHSISVEDLLTWLEHFAAEQGPRLVQSGEKFSAHTLTAIAEKLWNVSTRLKGSQNHQSGGSQVLRALSAGRR